jgi:Fe2+ or Zn2+ uptake regulation protein
VPHPSTTDAATRLRTRGLRATAPRIAVLAVLDEAALQHEHLAVTEVINRVGAIGSQSRQATYDCLDALALAGLARKIEPAGQPALYEGRVGDNHHHLVCRSCGKVVDLDCDTGLAPCITPADTRGFLVDEAEVVLWGVCPSCADAQSSATPVARTTVTT